MTSASYFTVGVNDMGKARAFYDALLGPQGFAPFYALERGCIYASQDTSNPFAVLTPENGAAASVGNGSMGGLRVASGQAVAALHAQAPELGGSTAGDPGERLPGTQFGYFRDLDGNTLCAFSIG